MSSKAILASPFAEVQVTLQAFNYLLNASNPLFFMSGRGSKLVNGLDPAEQWNDDTNPPEPKGTLEEQEELWAKLLYGRTIPKENISLVMPAIQGGINIIKPWNDRDQSEITFVTFNRATEFSFGFEQNRLYAREIEPEVYQVFMAMEMDDTNGIATGGEPPEVTTTMTFESDSPTPASIDLFTDDEYFKDGTDSILHVGNDRWKYLYTLHAQSDLIPIAGPVENNFWFPVNFGNKTNENGNVLDDVPNLPFILGPRNIAIQISLPANFDPIEFRQNWIVVNPGINSGDATATDPQKEPGAFVSNTGHIYYIEHRPPQIKQENQEERILIALNY